MSDWQNKVKAHVYWSKQWTSDFDAALEVLPESELCPHELYRLLCKNQDPTKIYAIIENESNEPIAVICLRKRINLDDWVTLTHYSIPGMLFPVRDNYINICLSVLDRNIRLAWWRMGKFSGHINNIKSLEVKPTYEIDLTGDYEKYLRALGNLNTVKQARKRCQNFEIGINAHGMTEWVIRNWDRKWRENPCLQRPDLRDKLIVTEYLQRLGKSLTFTLMDSGRPICGHTFLVHRNQLVWQYVYRESQYDKFGIGTYLMDYAAKWALGKGFSGIDLGGDYPESKRRWGPIKDSKTSIHICPNNLYKYLCLKHRTKEILAYIRAKGVRQSFLTAKTRVIDKFKML